MGLKKRSRQENILAALRSRPSARLGELAEQFAVSKETIRRDIAELSSRGLVARTYGGALPSRLNAEPRLRERMRINPEGRRRMAETAARLVRDARVLMIDTGATMSHVCERLAAVVPQDARAARTVITNGIHNLTILAENPAIRTIVCPGTYDEGEGATFGPLTLEFIGRFHAEAMIVSASGMDAERVTDANSDAVAIKRAMLKLAERRILVIDVHKLGQAQFETVCGLEALDDVVTDAEPAAAIRAALERAGARLHVAAERAGQMSLTGSGAL
ncbi:MAG TPA: DeoR/GlpR transcriptional regulator [Alphaproteobacteria bacterium]|nr:DeoR/GlpR transcriptional regulator [Alphaproteobacteria bacterium]